MASVYKFKFQVRGKVQGVFFRKYTKMEADKLDIKGFVRNENDGSVTGEGQTTEESKMKDFRHFLEKVGSPNSNIESCTFEVNTNQPGYDYDDFTIRY